MLVCIKSVCVYLCVCASISVCVRAFAHATLQSTIVCLRACICARACTFVRVCVCMCLSVCVRCFSQVHVQLQMQVSGVEAVSDQLLPCATEPKGDSMSPRLACGVSHPRYMKHKAEKVHCFIQLFPENPLQKERCDEFLSLSRAFQK